MKTAYRTVFAAYFALFLWLMHSCATQGQWSGLWVSAVFAAPAGWMLWLSIFRTRH